ncbi:MAG: ABC transporter ATP-binding protein, partial [Spirochaetales bacterium]|nr:ABC transporter ATP-binding protein [Spirochaetales bacterium]
MSILKYLKESRLPIFIVVILLIVRVVANLTLPLFTSQIVNVGLQQGGIESPIPIVLTVETFKLLEGQFEDAERLKAAYDYDAEQGGYLLIDESQIGAEEMGSALARIRMSDPEGLSEQAAFQQIREEYIELGIDVGKLQNRFILKTGAKMVGVSIVSALSMISVAFFASRSAARFGQRLRKEVFTKVVSFSQAEMDNFSTASLVTRSTNDIQQIQQSFVMILRVVIYAPLMAVGGILRVMN